MVTYFVSGGPVLGVLLQLHHLVLTLRLPSCVGVIVPGQQVLQGRDFLETSVVSRAVSAGEVVFGLEKGWLVGKSKGNRQVVWVQIPILTSVLAWENEGNLPGQGGNRLGGSQEWFSDPLWVGL